MAGWGRHLPNLLRRVVGDSGDASSAAACFSRLLSSPCSSSSGVALPLSRVSRYFSTTSSRPGLHQYFQRSGISSSRILLADSAEATPISSPLTPALPLPSGSAEEQKVIAKRSKVQAVLKGIKQSPKKVNLVAALVRGMRVEDALLQLQVTVKRAAKTVYQVIHSARANATHNHGLDGDRLLVAEAFVGKGFFKKRVNYHGKGKCGIKVRPECRLTVILREVTPEEEAEIAKLKVSNFKKLTKRERQLVPHKLIETTPVWNRKGKTSRIENATTA
ncbi:hypothetical protein MLD38_040755 [Melastoma candidum]|nr:hypothetical protein MLD38_040755 [Melastoma candidum]